MFLSLRRCFETIVTYFYQFGNLLKQSDVFLSLWQSSATMQCVFITSAIFQNNVIYFDHFGNLLKQCDVFLSLWQFKPIVTRRQIYTHCIVSKDRKNFKNLAKKLFEHLKKLKYLIKFCLSFCSLMVAFLYD